MVVSVNRGIKIPAGFSNSSGIPFPRFSSIFFRDGQSVKIIHFVLNSHENKAIPYSCMQMIVLSEPTFVTCKLLQDGPADVC